LPPIDGRPILFSTNTWLAWTINERFYGGRHFVWVSPFFAPEDAPEEYVVPPSSTPCIIFQRFREDIRGKDLDSAAIRTNRMGLRDGAQKRFAEGLIDEKTRDLIWALVDAAERTEFRPRVYAIPRAAVEDELEEPQKRAHPLSAEWVIRNLSRDNFGVVDFHNRV